MAQRPRTALAPMPTPAKKPLAPVATPAKFNQFSNLPYNRSGTHAKGTATGARTVGTHARQAMDAFLAAMTEEGGGGYLAFGQWCHNYRAMRLEYGWPPLSDKVLSLALQSMGCKRRLVDARTLQG